MNMTNEEKILNSTFKEIFFENKEKTTLCQAIIRIDENIQKLRNAENENLTLGELDKFVNKMLDDVSGLLDEKNFKKISEKDVINKSLGEVFIKNMNSNLENTHKANLYKQINSIQEDIIKLNHENTTIKELKLITSTLENRINKLIKLQCEGNYCDW
ncbi:hypothetical protein [Oceanirhabdus sp. W0125-5]|uniref:hypothetical protein n=1 Tax=Oceanirhabdus sp. W0125-5 TaxID=2999116 RepID=UPI0022F311F4|nr:hypothetical protein [Oceanirhabdus sp. W0125-5]WBW99123.1 hypothetical protein OW730_10360 [Oceanirhabdus sp. W0125-5]